MEHNHMEHSHMEHSHSLYSYYCRSIDLKCTFNLATCRLHAASQNSPHLKTGLQVQDIMLSIQQLLTDLALGHFSLIQGPPALKTQSTSALDAQVHKLTALQQA